MSYSGLFFGFLVMKQKDLTVALGGEDIVEKPITSSRVLVDHTIGFP